MDISSEVRISGTDTFLQPVAEVVGPPKPNELRALVSYSGEDLEEQEEEM